MKNIKNWVFRKTAPLVIFTLSASTVMATGAAGGKTPSGDSIITIPNPLGVNSFGELLNRIIDFLIFIGTPLVTLMILWAAFQIMKSGGNEEEVLKGRKTIQWAALGYILLLISKGIVLVINSILGTS